MYNSPCDTHASLAQLDRVVHYECKGLGFESLMTHHRKRLVNGSFSLSLQTNSSFPV